jgi:hypothetical protein
VGLKRILIGIFAGFTLLAQAEEVADLYSALVPVPDQSSASRAQGVSDAFEKVLIKLTGNSDIMQRPQLQIFLPDPMAFLDSVGFGEINNPSPDKNNIRGLDVKFDRKSIDKLLRQVQLPVVPANRPQFLVWIIVDDMPLGRRFINESVAAQNIADDYSTQFLNAFDIAMQDRAISYFLPSYDLEDQLSLSVNEAWSLRVDLLDKASQRYAADGWFAIRIYTGSDGESRGAWAYQHAGMRQMNDFRGQSLDQLVTHTVDNIADSLMQYFTYVPQLESDQLLIEIDGISAYKQYQSVLEQLKKLELVDSLQLFSIREDKMVVAVEIKGKADRLHAELLRDQRLKPKISGDYRSIGRLTYNWIEQ